MSAQPITPEARKAVVEEREKRLHAHVRSCGKLHPESAYGYLIGAADAHKLAEDIMSLLSVEAALQALEAEKAALETVVKGVTENIPMDYLKANDVPGATGPTSALNLVQGRA